jgi:hypothetical protein
VAQSHKVSQRLAHAREAVDGIEEHRIVDLE